MEDRTGDWVRDGGLRPVHPFYGGCVIAVVVFVVIALFVIGEFLPKE